MKENMNEKRLNCRETSGLEPTLNTSQMFDFGSWVCLTFSETLAGRILILVRGIIKKLCLSCKLWKVAGDSWNNCLTCLETHLFTSKSKKRDMQTDRWETGLRWIGWLDICQTCRHWELNSQSPQPTEVIHVFTAKHDRALDFCVKRNVIDQLQFSTLV